MPSRFKLALAVVLGTVLLATVVVALPAWLVLRDGFLEVSVHEARPGGSRVDLRLPGSLVRLACAVAPRVTLDHAGNDAEALRGVSAALAAAATALDGTSDAILLQVEEAGDRVVIAKRDGALVIEVDDASGDHVRVTLPARVLAIVTETLPRLVRVETGPEV